MERVRWGNVARLAGVVLVAALVAFGPRGCGRSEPPRIPLDTLPGEAVAGQPGVEPASGEPPLGAPPPSPRAERVRSASRKRV